MNTKLTSRQQQAMDTKNKIYNSAIHLFTKEGYNKVNISHICKSANVSVGCFYHHYKSKECILMEAYDRADKEVQIILKNKSLSGNWFEKIISLFTFQTEGAEKLGVELMIQLYKNQITIDNTFLFSEGRILPSKLKNIISKGKASGNISKKYSTEFIIRDLLRFSRGIIYDWCSHKGNYNLTEDMKKSLSVYLNCFIE